MNEQILKELHTTNESVVPNIAPGDVISVFLRIKEGSNERVQEFKGTVLGTKAGKSNTFTVRRIASNGVGVERTFLMNSPRIEKVVVHRSSQVRRAKLYHLRERTGKSARLKQKFN